MRYYYIECDLCGSESQVSIDNSTTPEPEYCPICVTEVHAELIDGDEDSDDPYK